MAKFYLVNPSYPAKTTKTQGHITSEQEINPVQIPHSSKATFKFPPSPGTWHSQMLGVWPGGILKVQFDRYVKFPCTSDVPLEGWPFVRSTPADILHNWTFCMQSTMGSYEELHRDVATSYIFGTQGWRLTAPPQQGGCRTSKRRTTAYSRGGDAPGIDSTAGTPAKRTRCSRCYCTATHWRFQPFFSLRLDCA